jgi:two-component system, OmpR family, KDP operon response regulator KdpE
VVVGLKSLDGEAAPKRAGARVLLVEADRALTRLIVRKLRRHSFSIEAVTCARDGRAAFERFHPDLVLLDLDLGDSSGWDFITDVRTRGAVPIVTLSGVRTERHAVSTLELGADDFLIKPFGLDELLARIRVALRHVARPRAGAEPLLQLGNLELDLERRAVFRDRQPMHVTPTEYQLLKVFATHPDRFLSDRFLIDAVWGPGWRGGEHILHVCVARLRKKVEPEPATPRALLNESGLGYRFATSDS